MDQGSGRSKAYEARTHRNGSKVAVERPLLWGMFPVYLGELSSQVCGVLLVKTVAYHKRNVVQDEVLSNVFGLSPYDTM